MRSGVVILSESWETAVATVSWQARSTIPCRPVQAWRLSFSSYDEQSLVPGGCHYTHIASQIYIEEVSFSSFHILLLLEKLV